MEEAIMPAMTLRLDDSLAKKLDRICHKKGYKKTGVITRLVRDFVEKEGSLPHSRLTASDLQPLVGIVHIGGDSVEDAENYF